MDTKTLVFSPIQFGALHLRNRIVMAPMTRRMAAEDGVVTDAIVEYYRRRAEGEVGLIISEGTPVDSLHAYDTLTVPRFDTDEQIVGWKRVVDAVHKAGGAFAPQLWHTGRLGADPIGPSSVTLPPKADGTQRPLAREMTDADFKQVTEAFVHAACAAKDIGCDAIELHGAHGYLLDSFVSPVNNQRSDKYGGSLENRMRFPCEVLAAVRKAVGAEFPIIYRFSQWKVDDFAEIKFSSSAELTLWTNALKESGADILHVSTRSAVDVAFPNEDSELTLAGWSKRLSGLPVIAVGKISVTLTMDQAYGEQQDAVSDPTDAFKLIESGEADLLAVGRALIANPDWVKTVRDKNWRELTPFNKSMLADL